ncbi:Peptide chain release factor 2 [Morella rubra]|uniref:Peptide chain release factor 2 n=1 Tax=Morella rubra TaxID=262757 RepID=A0A6A1W9Y3_9ROSI|nr:Peptide chain release factor 2 [Morella rubra]
MQTPQIQRGTAPPIREHSTSEGTKKNGASGKKKQKVKGFKDNLESLVGTQSKLRSVEKAVNPKSQLKDGVDADATEWAMQDFYSLRRDVETTSERVEEIRASAGLQQLEQERADLELKAADSSFWDDQDKAQETLSALTDVKDKLKLLTEFKTQVEEAETIVKLTEEMDSKDTGLLEEAVSLIKELNKAVDRFELTQLLSGPYDKEGAVISITAGAGGTDAQSGYLTVGVKQPCPHRMICGFLPIFFFHPILDCIDRTFHLVL